MNSFMMMSTHKVLPVEWAKRDILPLLYVPRRPVVHEYHAKHVALGRIDVNGLAECIAWANETGLYVDRNGGRGAELLEMTEAELIWGAVMNIR